MPTETDGVAHRSGSAGTQAQMTTPPHEVEYLRRVYANTREWYAVAEKKAQLLLTANGAFVTIVFGALLSRNGSAYASAARAHLATIIFLGASGVAVVAAIACAALSLWSLHGKADAELLRLGVDPANPDSYKPEALWYFGHLARLREDAAVRALSRAGQECEVAALSLNTVDLARKVLRKHRWVNAGWGLTSIGLITLAGAAASFLSYA